MTNGYRKGAKKLSMGVLPWTNKVLKQAALDGGYKGVGAFMDDLVSKNQDTRKAANKLLCKAINKA